MTYHNVECERVQPLAPEAYICRWADRHTLALGLLSEGKGSRTSEHRGIEGIRGITGRPFAMVTIEAAL